jgi:hypothetical protein
MITVSLNHFLQWCYNDRTVQHSECDVAVLFVALPRSVAPWDLLKRFRFIHIFSLSWLINYCTSNEIPCILWAHYVECHRDVEKKEEFWWFYYLEHTTRNNVQILSQNFHGKLCSIFCFFASFSLSFFHRFQLSHYFGFISPSVTHVWKSISLRH